MLFAVTHSTNFAYSQPVFLEPHSVRLRPREDSCQKLLDFEMRVEPRPAGVSSCVDLDGNVTSRVWFDDLQETLNITTTFAAETLRTNPFDFILDPGGLVLPMVYSEEVAAVLAPYRDRASSQNESSRFAEAIAEEVGRETVPFLSLLTRRIQEKCEPIVRGWGAPWPPAVTLTRRQAACRDLAVLLMDACRAMGIGARFVSGYHEGDSMLTERELHAWVEVYLPGAGWRGYDAMYGSAVSDRHIALAAGPTPHAAAPTSGTFRGTGATSTMQTEIRMMVTNPGPNTFCADASQTSCQNSA